MGSRCRQALRPDGSEQALPPATDAAAAVLVCIAFRAGAEVRALCRGYALPSPFSPDTVECVNARGRKGTTLSLEPLTAAIRHTSATLSSQVNVVLDKCAG